MKKIYIVLEDSAYDYDQSSRVLIATTDYNKAQSEYNRAVKEARKNAKAEGFIIEETPNKNFESYKDGYAAKEHWNISLLTEDLVEVQKTPSVEERLQSALESLNAITQSGYWPFASPNPCSTEARIKKGVLKAIAGLEEALTFHRQEFGKGKLNPMGPHATVITKRA